MQKIEKEISEIKEWNVELETSVLKQEMERALLMIRLRNFPEAQKEKTSERVASWLVTEKDTEIDEEKVRGDGNSL